MKTLAVCVMFLICAVASSVMGPPIVNRSGYFYNLDPRKHYLKDSRPFHQILKGEKPQISGDSTRVGVHEFKNHWRVSSKPVHPNVKPERPYQVAKPGKPVYREVAYFGILGCLIGGICVFCVPLFCFFKKLVNRICTGAPELQRPAEEIIMYHM